MAARDTAAPAAVLSPAADASSAAGDGSSELAAAAAAEQAAAAAAADAALAAAREQRDAAMTRVRVKLQHSQNAGLWRKVSCGEQQHTMLTRRASLVSVETALQPVSLALS